MAFAGQQRHLAAAAFHHGELAWQPEGSVVFNLKSFVPSLLVSTMCAQACASAAASGHGAATVATQYVQVDGNEIAYRVLGDAPGVPLVLLNRFRGTMDHWDPVLIDRIATERRVLMFDQPGFARSGGQAPDSLLSLDVTEQRVTEATLRESEERFALAVAGCNDGIWHWDIATGLQYYSARATDLRPDTRPHHAPPLRVASPGTGTP